LKFNVVEFDHSVAHAGNYAFTTISLVV